MVNEKSGEFPSSDYIQEPLKPEEAIVLEGQLAVIEEKAKRFAISAPQMAMRFYHPVTTTEISHCMGMQVSPDADYQITLYSTNSPERTTLRVFRDPQTGSRVWTIKLNPKLISQNMGLGDQDLSLSPVDLTHMVLSSYQDLLENPAATQVSLETLAPQLTVIRRKKEDK